MTQVDNSLVICADGMGCSGQTVMVQLEIRPNVLRIQKAQISRASHRASERVDTSSSPGSSAIAG